MPRPKGYKLRDDTKQKLSLSASLAHQKKKALKHNTIYDVYKMLPIDP